MGKGQIFEATDYLQAHQDHDKQRDSPLRGKPHATTRLEADHMQHGYEKQGVQKPQAAVGIEQSLWKVGETPAQGRPE